MYKITDYSKRQAEKLGLTVKPSTNKNKKLDVFRDGNRIASIGAAGYSDYPSYIKSHGQDYANERRRLYKLRHDKDSKKVDSPGFLASRILW